MNPYISPKDMINIMKFFVKEKPDFMIHKILCDSDYADERNKFITIDGNRDFKNERIDVCRIAFSVKEDSWIYFKAQPFTRINA